MLTAWGRAVPRLRWWIVVLSLVPLAPWLWLTGHDVHLDEGVVPPTMEAVQAVQVLESELAPRPPFFGLAFRSATLPATDPAFRAAMLQALDPLHGDGRVARVRTPWEGGPGTRLLSPDGRVALAIVELYGRAPTFASTTVPSAPPDVYPALRAKVVSDRLEILPWGPMALNHDFTMMVKRDLRVAEIVVLPLVLVFLLLVFGSLVAAALPLVVGCLGVAAGMGATTVLAHVMPVSAYANNVVSMIGLGVAIDYSLFVVSRFKEERRLGAHEALPRALATSGRTVLFSGLTVAIGLLGMILLRMGSVSTLGIASTIVVGFAVLYSLTLLPALLVILGPRIDALPVLPGRFKKANDAFWPRLTSLVMARPWLVLIPVVAGLVILGLPFRHIQLGSPDLSTLPATAESRRGHELVAREMPQVAGTPILLVLRYPEGPVLTAARIGELHDLSRWLASLPGVQSVDSAVDLDPRLRREDYQAMAQAPPEMLPPPLREAWGATVGTRATVLAVHTHHAPHDEQARALVRQIRAGHPVVGADVLITGQTAYDIDFIELVRRVAPAAIAFVIAATAVVLFMLLGSVLLPLKAVVMNLLSITASYGALVWIFQDGHFADWLGFTPAPVEPVIPLIMFCVLFGLSMDYEVLLLSRTHEEWERTGDNDRAVACALASTGRLITGAAAIMAAVFFGFGTAQAIMIKEMGVGMGIAVVMDATVVRGLLVPATMKLLGRWNWWAPAPLRRLHRRVRRRRHAH